MKWLGAAAAVVIVVASILVRSSGPPDAAADVGDQRADVTRFHKLVRDGRWDEVFQATSEPPAPNAEAFRELMTRQVREQGKVVAVRIDSLRLLRSRTVPLLEVEETVTTRNEGEVQRTKTVSYYARRKDRWLFAFSAPAAR
jgi:hypothetical protein